MKKMITHVASALLVILPPLFGMFLPYLFPANGVGLSGYANLPWSTVYGFGWFLTGLFTDPRLRAPALFGSLLWPIFVTFASFYIARKYWPRLDDRSRVIAVILFVCSFCVDVPLELALREPLSYLPLYYKYMFVAY